VRALKVRDRIPCRFEPASSVVLQSVPLPPLYRESDQRLNTRTAPGTYLCVRNLIHAKFASRVARERRNGEGHDEQRGALGEGILMGMVAQGVSQRTRRRIGRLLAALRLGRCQGFRDGSSQGVEVILDEPQTIRSSTEA
jgi:hypothetical protein